MKGILLWIKKVEIDKMIHITKKSKELRALKTIEEYLANIESQWCKKYRAADCDRCPYAVVGKDNEPHCAIGIVLHNMH